MSKISNNNNNNNKMKGSIRISLKGRSSFFFNGNFFEFPLKKYFFLPDRESFPAAEMVRSLRDCVSTDRNAEEAKNRFSQKTKKNIKK